MTWNMEVVPGFGMVVLEETGTTLKKKRLVIKFVLIKWENM